MDEQVRWDHNHDANMAGDRGWGWHCRRGCSREAGSPEANIEVRMGAQTKQMGRSSYIICGALVKFLNLSRQQSVKPGLGPCWTAHEACLWRWEGSAMGPPPRLPFTSIPWAGGLCLALGATGVSQSQPVSLTLAPCVTSSPSVP